MPGTLDLMVQGAQFPYADLDSNETQLFDNQFAEMFCTPWAIERMLIQSRRNNVLAAIGVAKNEFKGKGFGGFNAAAGQIGISPIRPGQVGLCKSGSDTAAEGDNTWIWTSGNTALPAYGTGNDNWIHSPNTATTNFTLAQNPGAIIFPFYLVEENPSAILQTLKMDIGRANILYIDCSMGRVRDEKAPGVSIYPLPNTIWKPATTVKVAIQTTKAGYMNLRLGGFAIGEAEFLQAQTYTASTNTVTATENAAT